MVDNNHCPGPPYELTDQGDVDTLRARVAGRAEDEDE